PGGQSGMSTSCPLLGGRSRPDMLSQRFSESEPGRVKTFGGGNRRGSTYARAQTKTQSGHGADGYSITSSASASNFAGTSMPSVLGVLRLRGSPASGWNASSAWIGRCSKCAHGSSKRSQNSRRKPRGSGAVAGGLFRRCDLFDWRFVGFGLFAEFIGGVQEPI